MLKVDSTAGTLVVAVLVAVAIAYTASNLSHMAMRDGGNGSRKSAQSASATPVKTTIAATNAGTADWVASAPGRVDPWGGDIRVAAETSGKVLRVIAKQNDRVSSGDLMVLLDDVDAQLRLRAAEANEALRKRERDSGTVGRSVLDRREIEDAFADAERAMHKARIRLDQALLDAASGTGNPKAIGAARAGIERGEADLRKKRNAWEVEKNKDNAALPTRAESALTAARSDLALAEQALERTRIRAPADGTVLQIEARVGETVVPNPSAPIALLGDLTRLRVKAEVEERNISNIRVGQLVVVKSNSFPDQEFTGKVYRIAKALGGPELGPRGPRRPNDLDVLETMIEMDTADVLLPGMRVDVFFRPDTTANTTGSIRTN